MSNLNVNDFVKAVLVENRITPELLSLCSQVLAQPRSLRLTFPVSANVTVSTCNLMAPCAVDIRVCHKDVCRSARRLCCNVDDPQDQTRSYCPSHAEFKECEALEALIPWMVNSEDGQAPSLHEPQNCNVLGMVSILWDEPDQRLRGTPAVEALVEELGHELPNFLWTWLHDIRTNLLPFEESLPPAFLDPCRRQNYMPRSPLGDQRHGILCTAGTQAPSAVKPAPRPPPTPLCRKDPAGGTGEAPAPARIGLRHGRGPDAEDPRLDRGRVAGEESLKKLCTVPKSQPSHLLIGRTPAPAVAPPPAADGARAACSRSLLLKERPERGEVGGPDSKGPDSKGPDSKRSRWSLKDDAQLCGVVLVCHWAFQWARWEVPCRVLRCLPREPRPTFYQEGRELHGLHASAYVRNLTLETALFLLLGAAYILRLVRTAFTDRLAQLDQLLPW